MCLIPQGRADFTLETLVQNKEVHTAGHKYCSYQVIGNVETGTILMVCCMDSLNVLFLACKRFKTQLHVL